MPTMSEHLPNVAPSTFAADAMEYLRTTPVIDWDDPAVLQQAQALSTPSDPTKTAAACFHWVRDQIAHSADAQRNPVTCQASQVLRHRTGYCYAKSHLLAALLRANGIPAGFCYQRLSLNDAGPPYVLHGFNAVLLPRHGWYRCDPRGNRPGIDAQFTPPLERLAFPLRVPGEVEFANILPNPLTCVLDCLQHCRTWQEALASLPDIAPECWTSLGVTPRQPI